MRVLRRLAISITHGALAVSTKASDGCLRLLARLGDGTYGEDIEDTRLRIERLGAEHRVLATARYARDMRRRLTEHSATNDPIVVLQHQVYAADYLRAVRAEDLAVDALIALTPPRLSSAQCDEFVRVLCDEPPVFVGEVPPACS